MNSEPVLRAFVRASTAVTEIVGELHSLHYCGRSMSQHQRELAITDARKHAERLLTDLIAAEADIRAPVPA